MISAKNPTATADTLSGIVAGSKSKHLKFWLAMGIAGVVSVSLLTSGAELEARRTQPETKTNLTFLIETIEREWPVGIRRDPNNNVETVILPVRYATDKNLELLASSKSLRRLTFSYNQTLREPTPSGIIALQHAPELKELSLQCSAETPSSFFDSVSKLHRLEKLTLVKFCPVEGDYSILTNLARLRDLTITMPVRFGTNEIRALSKIRHLQNLHIFSEQLSEADLLPLIQNSAITNLVVEDSRWKLRVTRETK